MRASVVVGYSFSHAWVLREGARSWVPLTSVTCPGDASTLSPLQFMSVNDDCTTVAFVCPALCFNSGMCNDRGSVVVVDVLLDTVINGTPPASCVALTLMSRLLCSFAVATPELGGNGVANVSLRLCSHCCR